MDAAFKELADFCHTGDLSWPLLRQKLDVGPDDLVRGNLSEDVDDDNTLLHYACYNRRVTLDVVRGLVGLYPEAVEVLTGYGCWLPLHRACSNPACPDDVVVFLMELHPAASSVPWPHAGLPLHCLLARPARDNIDGEEVRYRLNLDIVRRLAEAHPESLTNQNNGPNRTPLLCAVEREDVSLDMVRLLVDPTGLAVGLSGGYSGLGGEIPLVALMKVYRSDKRWRAPYDVVQFLIQSAPYTITPSALIKICRGRSVTLDVVKLMVESRPNVSFFDQADDDGMFALHSICLNERKEDQNSRLLPIIVYIVTTCPQSVRERNSYGFLPLGYAVRTTHEITKYLVEKYPESVTVWSRGGTAFDDALCGGGIDTVKYLFEKDPAVIKSTSHPALHRPFSFNRDVEAKVNFLLEANAQLIRAEDRSTGNLPLHAACSSREVEFSLIKKLFYLYPNAIAARNNKGRFPLHEFLAKDRIVRESEDYPDDRCGVVLETVEFLVTQFLSSVRIADEDKMLPLHYASMNYHTAIARYLIQTYPESVQMESPKFGLPLHCAAQKHRNGLQLVRHLSCEYPAALNKKNDTVGIPLECTNDQEIFIHLLRRRYPAKMTNYVHQVLKDDALLDPMSVVRVFLQNFCGNVEEIDKFGRYPLHVAVSSSRVSHIMIRELLGAHPAAALHQEKHKCIPLHLFFRHNGTLDSRAFEEIFDELMSSRNQSARMRNCNGLLPLHFACQYGAVLTVLKKLIDYYPEAVRARDQNGCIPLHVACRSGVLSVDAMDLLVGNDTAMVQKVDVNLELPLHKACRGGHLEIIHYLLDQFPSASGVRNISGYLPIHILCRKSGKADSSIMDTPKFTETVFRLLRAYPEAVM
ncbi:hypothetical protein ACHAWF_014142 [Thalassiosira exigua]